MTRLTSPSEFATSSASDEQVTSTTTEERAKKQVAKTLASRYKSELKNGKTYKGVPLNDEPRQTRIAFIEKYTATLPARYQCALSNMIDKELASIDQTMENTEKDTFGGLQATCTVCMNNYERRKRPRKDNLDQKVDEAEKEEEKEEEEGHDHEHSQKRSEGGDLYVFKNFRLLEYKIARSSDTMARTHHLQQSQNFDMQTIAVFEGKGYLENKVRTMLAYCLLPPEVAAGKEWHARSLQTALGAFGQAIESEQVNA